MYTDTDAKIIAKIKDTTARMSDLPYSETVAVISSDINGLSSQGYDELMRHSSSLKNIYEAKYANCK